MAVRPASLHHVERARRAVAAVFLVNGVVIASWVPHIPALKQRIDVGEATLGLLLLAMAAGAVLAFPVTSYLVGRCGSRRVTAVAAILLSLALPLPVASPTAEALAAALFVFGAANGALDVSMNAQAVLVEKHAGRPILSSLHALYSAGGIVGAGTAVLFLWVGIPALPHAVATSVACLAVVATARPLLLESDVAEKRDAPFFVLPERALLVLGSLAFLGLMAEGAMADWSALWFRSTLLASPAMASSAFAVFSLAMTAGRFGGDTLAQRVGARRLLASSAWLAAGGLAVALLVREPWIALAGCLAVGFGIANVVPILFRAAANSSRPHPERGIAAVTTTGYFGFLAGPPLIGFVAEATSLSVGLGVVAAACAAIAIGGARTID